MELLRLIRQSMPSEHCNEGGGVGEGSNKTYLGHNRHDLGSDAYFHIILLLLLICCIYVRHLSVCTHLHKYFGANLHYCQKRQAETAMTTSILISGRYS